MSALNRAAILIRELSKQVTQESSLDSARKAANMLGDVAKIVEDLDSRFEAMELIVSTLAKKQGFTVSQVRREELAPPANQTMRLHQQAQYDAISTQIDRIISKADN
jgi:hypothetical protein